MFAVSVSAVYGSSALYHGTTGARRDFWQRTDHASIFLLIAGSVTSFVVAGHPSIGDWLLLASVWFVALFGMTRQLVVPLDAPAEVGIYLLIGWLGVTIALKASLGVPAAAAGLLVGGAAFYTVGTCFYRAGGRLSHAHALWHCFVMAGMACHYLAVASLLQAS